ncbi:hypothetical protein V502_06786 [Pseudogymnoascus sp. VKM F-4520 (FW-2644)]|nr:hypothetical protein V502_06786 [Pseudogymnoascus sp. VKM F-4520 (FW-2644)]
MADTKTTRAHPAIEPPPTLRPRYRARTSPHTRIGAQRTAVGGEHAGFEHPYRICGEGCEEACAEGREEVVAGCEGAGVPGAVPREGRFNEGFKVEEEGPGGAVSEEVRGEAAVEGGEGVGVREEGAGEREGGGGRVGGVGAVD